MHVESNLTHPIPLIYPISLKRVVISLTASNIKCIARYICSPSEHNENIFIFAKSNEHTKQLISILVLIHRRKQVPEVFPLIFSSMSEHKTNFISVSQSKTKELELEVFVFMRLDDPE